MAFWLIAAFLFVNLVFESVGLSYSHDGSWQQALNASECNSLHICTPSNLTWSPTDPFKKYRNNVTACSLLQHKGIRVIYFHGDSYMRQMYAAMMITLNGDYRYGSIANSTKNPECEYHKQFNEKNCGKFQLDYKGSACNDTIRLVPFLNELQGTNDCDGNNGSVVLWSFGNHKVMKGFGLRFGINNATEFQKFFDRDICVSLRNNTELYSGQIGPTNVCSVWWVSTHYRMVAWSEDESVEVVRNFNEEMRHYFDTGGCGNVNYIDVYNMTRHLAINHPNDAEVMTYDKVHWGMEVNLIKAQLIIDALLSR